MRSLLFLLLFISVANSARSQTQKISFSIFSSEIECSTIPKSFTLFYRTPTGDSLIRQDSLKDCLNEIEFLKMIGEYRVLIRANEYENINANFEVTNTTPALIDLKLLELKKKVNQLGEVSITGIKRSFIKVDADKTTITVKDNPILTISSLYDAIIKIPGVVPSPGGGFTVYGKDASIYFENIPSNMAGDDLTNLMKSLPAVSVEKIEIISNPGASYDANVSGAIINIVSLSKVSKWFSGTATLNYGVNANNKLLPSLIMSSKNLKYSWQLQTGYSYFERTVRQNNTKTFTSFDPMVQMKNYRLDQNQSGFFYIKPSVNFRFGKRKQSTLVLNYNGSFNNSNNAGNATTSSQEISPAIDINNTYKVNSTYRNNEMVVNYKYKLDTLKRTMDVTAYYSDFDQGQLTKSIQRVSGTDEYSLLKYNNHVKKMYAKVDFDIPFEKRNFYLKYGAKYSKLIANSAGKYNLQNGSSALFDSPTYLSSLDFDYQEDNTAGYVEAKKGFGKLSVVAGVRVENFNLTRKSSVFTSKQFNYFNFFPSVNAIYRFSPDMNVVASYSRKIEIPSYSQFDPNNSGYYDNYNSTAGNIALNPNYFDNAEVKLSIFDYLQLSVNFSHSQTLNLLNISTQPQSLQSIQTIQTYHTINSLTYFFSIPIPFGIFKQGLAFFNNPIDIDKISYLYLFTERTKTTIDDLTAISTNKATWNHGVEAQIILPYKIRMNFDFMYGTRGMYQIFQLTQPRPSFELVFSRDFMNKKLKASVSFQDVFNRARLNYESQFENLTLVTYQKYDTRIIWFKLAYSFGKYGKPSTEVLEIQDAVPSQNSKIGI